MDDIVEVYALDVPLPPVRRGDLVFRLIGHLPPVAAWAVALETGLSDRRLGPSVPQRRTCPSSAAAVHGSSG